MQRILPALVLLGVLVLGVLAAKVFLPSLKGNSATEDVAETSGEEKKSDLASVEETKSKVNGEEEGDETPLAMPGSEPSKVAPAVKQDAPMAEGENTDTVPGYRRGTSRSGSVARSPARASAPAQNKGRSLEEGREENQRSSLVISPEQQRDLMRRYIEALTHLRE